MTILQCTLFFVLLSFFSEASALITMLIPTIIVAGQPFQVIWTRSATDPTSFFVELVQNGVVAVQGIPIRAKGTSGVITIPRLDLNPGSYLVRATESAPCYILFSRLKRPNHSASEGGNTLGESNVFEIRAPASSSPSRTIPEATGSTTMIPVTSPSAASKLPIIIGCVIAAVVVCASLTFLLCYLRCRSRQRRNQGQRPVSPFTDSQPASIRWAPGKVRQSFTISDDLRTSNTKTGTTFRPSPGDLPETTASGSVIEALDHSLRDDTDANEEFPLAAAVEIERLRLENRMLRRQIEPSSPVGETLPPSYPGSQNSSSDNHEA
ncbi:hypothetical protein C8J56DRAFT_960852 [Mycena floridula]|nr:hypothetical protein C8J56DRAFT_960852 [Mycena floridula]